MGGGFDVKMLDPQPPPQFFPWQFRHIGGSARSRAQPGGGRVGIANGGGQTDPTGLIADEAGDPGDLAQDLVAPIRARQGVDLVDDDVFQIPEQADHIIPPAHQHALQGFRGDLQYAPRCAEHLFLVGAGHIPVPVEDGDVRLVGQFRDSPKLIVDQAFQRGDVQHGNAGGVVLVDLGEDGKESRLRLAGRRGGGDQEIMIRVEDHFCRCDLHVMQLLPAPGVDELPDEGGKRIKYGVGHKGLLSCVVENGRFLKLPIAFCVPLDYNQKRNDKLVFIYPFQRVPKHSLQSRV